MTYSREELIRKIEAARKRLNESIDNKVQYEEIYNNSLKLDHLIEQYIVAGY